MRSVRVALACALGAILLTLPPILALRWIDPPITAFMVQSRMDARGSPAPAPRYQWVDLERIAPALRRAVVAAEDQRFSTHAGFDLHSIADAVEESARGGRRRGASTISQQVAKNLFLWPEKSWFRKLLEAWITLWIELLWPKERILEVYLNVAQFGDGLFGAEAASWHFFARPAAALSLREAALLAAVLPNPRRLHADRPSPYLASRVEWILDQMGEGSPATAEPGPATAEGGPATRPQPEPENGPADGVEEVWLGDSWPPPAPAAPSRGDAPEPLRSHADAHDEP